MIIESQSYNGADNILATRLKGEWEEIYNVLKEMPLYLKESDQAGIQGTPIFDVVGTNSFIKKGLESKNWKSAIPLPEEYKFMGTDVDYGKNGLLVEAQFSNYPFLLNNILRAELFYKGDLILAGKKTSCVIIITKAHMFPASNSTLYYEQGRNQLNALSNHKIFDVPIQLVGLKSEIGHGIPAVWTGYSARRYSRTVLSRDEIKCNIFTGRTSRSRCIIEVRKEDGQSSSPSPEQKSFI